MVEPLQITAWVKIMLGVVIGVKGIHCFGEGRLQNFHAEEWIRFPGDGVVPLPIYAVCFSLPGVDCEVSNLVHYCCIKMV